ncbi:MAG: site-specific integrase, partial [Duncaniella sp.]|nr:site-specific integrase [Duncaniella sp.]
MRTVNDVDKILKEYSLYLVLEKGVSENTREAYVRDVSRFLGWLASGGDGSEYMPSTLQGVETDTLRIYLGSLNDVGIAVRSRARIVASLRSFFAYLAIEGYIEASPGELLESPKLGLYLPEVLTVEEIDSMIESI